MSGRRLLSSRSRARRSLYSYGAVLYLNYDGATLTKGLSDDSRSNTSSIVDLDEGETVLAPFPDAELPPGARDRVTAHVRELFEPFNLTIVTERPLTGNYRMAVLTATEHEMDGEGVAARNSMLLENPNAVVIAWAGEAIAHLREVDQQTDAQLEKTLAIITAHEIGHTHGPGPRRRSAGGDGQLRQRDVRAPPR